MTATVNQIATPQLQHRSVQTIVNSHPQVFSLAIRVLSSAPAYQTAGGYWLLMQLHYWSEHPTPNSDFSSPAACTWPTPAPLHKSQHSWGPALRGKVQVP